MQQLQQVLQLSTNERAGYIAQNGDTLFATMLQHIGATDATIRDATNYRLFIELLNEQLIPRATLIEFTQQLVTNDFLYKGIYNGESDDVFTRSFAALWLTGIFHVDEQLHFLQPEQAQLLMEQCVSYLAKERDVRGFVEGKGWAHSVAHGADLAVAILSHSHAKMQYAPLVLQAVKSVFWKGTVFTDDEDERLVKILEVLIRNEFPEDVLVEWVEQLFDKLAHELYQVGYTTSFFHARTNTLQFAKTLYFTLKFSNQYDKLRGVTSLFIAKWLKMQ